MRSEYVGKSILSKNVLLVVKDWRGEESQKGKVRVKRVKEECREVLTKKRSVGSVEENGGKLRRRKRQEKEKVWRRKSSE